MRVKYVYDIVHTLASRSARVKGLGGVLFPASAMLSMGLVGLPVLPLQHNSSTTQHPAAAAAAPSSGSVPH